MQQTDDSAVCKMKLAELERERERLLEEEKCVEEAEACEQEAAAAQEREAATEHKCVHQQRRTRAEAQLEAQRSVLPETSRSGVGVSSSQCVVTTTSELNNTGIRLLSCVFIAPPVTSAIDWMSTASPALGQRHHWHASGVCGERATACMLAWW
jgi:hypothetical protein